MNAHSLKYLVVDADFQLGASIHLHMGFSMWSGLNFLTTRWLDSKVKYPEREKERQAEAVLPSNLENHVASHSLHATD